MSAGARKSVPSVYNAWKDAFRDVNKTGTRYFTGSEIGILFAAATYANHTTGAGVYPGATRLAEGLGMDRKTVYRALKKARRCNVLRLVSSGSSAGNASEYALVHPSDWSLSAPRGENGLGAKRERDRGRKGNGTRGENGSPTIHGTIHGTTEVPVTASDEAAPCPSESEGMVETTRPKRPTSYGRKKPLGGGSSPRTQTSDGTHAPPEPEP